MRISPLRRRMIGDMAARHFGEKTQKDYIRCVKNLAAFTGRAPETATAEDLRLYRLHLVHSPLGAARVNSAMTALRFFFSNRRKHCEAILAPLALLDAEQHA